MSMLINQNKPEKRKIDAYICENLHATITTLLDDHPGKPVALIACPRCKLPARSMGFMVNQSFKPSFEWYKPNPDEVKVFSLKIQDKNEYAKFMDQINKGMLLSRPVAKPVEKEGEKND